MNSAQEDTVITARKIPCNFMRLHFRGLLGVLVPLIISILDAAFITQTSLQTMWLKYVWIWMLFFFLFQPVNTPLTGLIPLFMFPMLAALPSILVPKCYFNDSVALFVLMSMMGLLFHQLGLDRHIIVFILSLGGKNQFGIRWLTIKASVAAFLLSAVCDRLFVTSIVIEYINLSMVSLQECETSDFLRTDIIIMAVQSSASLGSIVFIHSCPSILAFRAVLTDSASPDVPYVNNFNYMKYTAFALPLAVTMFICNLLYYLILTVATIKPQAESCAQLKNIVVKYKDDLIPKTVTIQKVVAVAFMAALLLLLLFRYPMWFEGWTNEVIMKDVPKVQDSTVAAMFVILLHILPQDLRFIRVLTAKKESDLPPLKACPSFLWWSLVNKHVNYGYMFLLGAAVALNKTILRNVLHKSVSNAMGTVLGLASMDVYLALFLIIFVSTVMANIMNGVGAAVVLFPLVVNMTTSWDNKSATKTIYEGKPYWAPIAVGMACTLGFMPPFMYTPAYFCHIKGKVPISKMIMWGFGSVLICMILLWLGISFYLPIVI